MRRCLTWVRVCRTRTPLCRPPRRGPQPQRPRSPRAKNLDPCPRLLLCVEAPQFENRLLDRYLIRYRRQFLLRRPLRRQ